jgi:hypothetical protein
VIRDLRKPLIRFFFLLLVLWLPASSPAQTNVPVIPEGIRECLDKNYPGWQLDPVSEEIKQFFIRRGFKFLPNWVTGDFDGNGRVDYGMKIVARGKFYIIECLSKKDGLENHLLVSGRGPAPEVYLALYKKGDQAFDFEKEQSFTLMKDSLEVGYFGKASVVYIYDNGKFREIFTSD